MIFYVVPGTKRRYFNKSSSSIFDLKCVDPLQGVQMGYIYIRFVLFSYILIYRIRLHPMLSIQDFCNSNDFFKDLHTTVCYTVVVY